MLLHLLHCYTTTTMNTIMTDMKPEELHMMNVSVFGTSKDSGNARKMTIMPLYKALSMGCDHIATIDRLRLYAGKETPEIEGIYKQLKGQLPVFTPSCKCGNGTTDVVEVYPILCLDIDFKDNPGMDIEKAKYDLINLPSVFYVSLSVGGKGLFALMALSGTDDFKARFNAAREYVLKTTGYTIDRSCSNVNRLRIISYDEDVMYKKGVVYPFPAKKDDASEPIYKPLITLPQKSHKMEENLLDNDKFCIAAADYCINHLGIKTGDYADWLSHMGALSTLGMDGESLAQQLSVQSPNYKDSDDVHKTIISTKGKRNHREYLLRYFKMCKDYLGRDWIKVLKARYELTQCTA